MYTNFGIENLRQFLEFDALSDRLTVPLEVTEVKFKLGGWRDLVCD